MADNKQPAPAQPKQAPAPPKPAPAPPKAAAAPPKPAVTAGRAPATLVLHPAEASLPPSLAVFLIGGALFHWLSFPPAEQAWAGWLAPLFLLAAMDRFATWRGRFKALFAVSLIAVAGELGWMWSEFGALAIFLWAIIALYFALWAGSLGAAASWPAPLAFLWPAVAWCGIEYLRGEVAPLRFSWLALGYSQQNALSTWLNPLVGVYGLSFLMVLWGTAAYHALHAAEGEGPQRNKGVAGLAALAIVPILSFFPPPAGPQQEPVATALLGQTIEALGATDAAPRPPAIATAAAPADLIVWPEYSIFNDPFREETSWFASIVRSAAATSKRGLIFGAMDIPKGNPSNTTDFQNTAFLLNPQGDVAGKAGKSQPVHLMRDGRAAPDVTILDIPGEPPLRVGVGVCFDGAYQQFSRRMADRGAAALIFPTYNKMAWGAQQHRQHQRMFQTRAAETALSVLCAANAGPTFAAAPGGRVIAELSFGAIGTLEAPIMPRGGPTTLFVRLGWMIGPAALFAFALGLVAAAWGAWLRAREAV
jgi:apolipoprotein N-acyltransferase